MSRLKDYLSAIVAGLAIIAAASGGIAYFAKASDLELVQLRLDQKIVSDQLYDTQKQAWALEERNVRYGADCSQWPDARDREQYKQLKVRLDELRKQQDKLIKK